MSRSVTQWSCKSVCKNSSTVRVFDSPKHSAMCNRTYFSLHCLCLLKNGSERRFGKHVLDFGIRDLSTTCWIFKSHRWRLGSLIYHVWATKWNNILWLWKYALEKSWAVYVYSIGVESSSWSSTSISWSIRRSAKSRDARNVCAPRATLATREARVPRAHTQ